MHRQLNSRLKADSAYFKKERSLFRTIGGLSHFVEEVVSEEVFFLLEFLFGHSFIEHERDIEA